MPTVLLVHCDGTNGSTTFTDVSPSAHPLTPQGGTVITTTSPKFGTGSAACAGHNGVLVTTGIGNTDFDFGAGQFTVEAWVWFTAAPTAVHAVVTRWGGSGLFSWFLGMNAATLNFFYSTTGSDNPVVSGAYSPTLNTWIHFAADRDASNVLRVYANGVIIASATVSATLFVPTQSVMIGEDGNGTRAFPGNIDEARVTKGTARYAGAFTPPTAPFADTAALATQTAVEHWLSTNPDAQTTQVLVEHWASVSSDNLQAVVTQVLIEQWASVASLSDVIPQNRIMVLA